MKIFGNTTNKTHFVHSKTKVHIGDDVVVDWSFTKTNNNTICNGENLL